MTFPETGRVSDSLHASPEIAVSPYTFSQSLLETVFVLYFIIMHSSFSWAHLAIISRNQTLISFDSVHVAVSILYFSNTYVFHRNLTFACSWNFVPWGFVYYYKSCYFYFLLLLLYYYYYIMIVILLLLL